MSSLLPMLLRRYHPRRYLLSANSQHTFPPGLIHDPPVKYDTDEPEQRVSDNAGCSGAYYRIMCLALNNTRHSPPLNRARTSISIAAPRLRPFPSLTDARVFPPDSPCPYFPFASSSSLDVAIILLPNKTTTTTKTIIISRFLYCINFSTISFAFYGSDILRNLSELFLVRKFNLKIFLPRDIQYYKFYRRDMKMYYRTLLKYIWRA